MIPNSVRNWFQKDWALFFDDELSCFLCCAVDSKYVISINSDCMHTIRRSPDCDTVTSVLIINWSRNCIHVVSAEEESLSSKCCSKVECRVEVTFRCSTFTEISHCDLIFTCDSIMISTPRSLWNLCAKWTRYRTNIYVSWTVMNRHLLTTTQIMLISS